MKTCSIEGCINKYHAKAYCKVHYRKSRLIIDIIGRTRHNKITQLWHKNNQEKSRDLDLKKRFGITLNDYNKMLEEQNGVCAVCKEKETVRLNGKVKRLCVDHDHKTGKVRGLLCMSCNIALGKLKDNSTIIESLLTYIKRDI